MTRLPDPPHADITRSRRILIHAASLGIIADLLLHDGPSGAAFPLWIALAAAALIALLWRDGRSLTREAAIWLGTAVVFASGLAFRDSPELNGLDFVITFGALAMAAVSIGSPRAGLLAARFRDTIWAAVALVRTGAAGFLPDLIRELFRTERRGRPGARSMPVIRSTLIAVSLIIVFGSLLRGADPIFASFVSLPDIDGAAVFAHVAIAVFYAWLVGGWARGALGAKLDAARAPDVLPVSLTQLDVTTALGTLNVLFGAFVIVQLSWFFGGEAFLQARTGLTASAYARQGFFEMLAVVMLVVPLLVSTRAVLLPGRALARRHTALSIPIVMLLGAILFSAAMRMKLYVHYYALTTDRFYPLVFMGWLAAVLAWLAVTVLRGRSRLFIAGVTISGLVVLAGLNLASPDAIVAQFNVNHVRETGADLDVSALTYLSADAAALATNATVATIAGTAERNQMRCDAATRLLDKWGPASRAAMRADRPAAWRSQNVSETHALRVVATHEPELREMRRTSCPAPKVVNAARPAAR
jgi:hypothetical protein